MPISHKQLRANRQNAKKSTGPRTSAGRQKSARNATRHGLYSADSVINTPHLKESQAEYNRFHEDLCAELKPRGVLQRQLVREITNCLWRQRRAFNAETNHLNHELTYQAELQARFADFRQNDAPSGACGEEEKLREEMAISAAANSIPTGSFAQALLRYEMRNDIRLTRAYDLLTRLQAGASSAAKEHSEEKVEAAKLYMRIEPISPQLPDAQNGTRSLDPEHHGKNIHPGFT